MLKALVMGMLAAPTSPASPPLPFAEAVRAGDLLYLSGQIGVAPGSAHVVTGGIPAETRQAMDNIGATLHRNGLGYEDLVRCTVMLTDMAQWPALNHVYASYFPGGRFPARSAIGAAALALGAHVEIECTARFGSRPIAVGAGGFGPYSTAVTANGFVYISGIIAYDAAGKRFADPGIEPQMRQVFANLDTVLAAGGLRREDIVRTTMFLHDAKDMPAANAAYATYFSNSVKPARTTVPGVDWGRPDLLVEIDAIAIAPDKRPGERP